MEGVFVQEKEFEEMRCVVHNIQICLNCGSERVSIIDNEITCYNCGSIKSKCEIKSLV